MDNKLALPAKPAETALAKEDDPITKKARELVTRLRLMIVNGKKLEDPEVFALAQYSAFNDLNPFIGEAYYLPGVGPTAGVLGWRKKAQEELEREAHNGGEIAATFWMDARDALEGEAVFGPGDIAVHVTLRDSLSNKIWRKAYFETVRELKALGDEKPFDNAHQFVGPEPVWTGVGVVYGGEKFAYEGKPEKWDRRERAMKRAEKTALKKRFPRINLPEPAGVNGDMVDAEWVKEEPAPLPEKHTEAENLAALGFAPMPAKQQESFLPQPEYQDEP